MLAALPPAQPLTTVTPSIDVAVAPTVIQTVKVEPTPARSDLLVGTEQWGWAELRDYVVAEIIDRFGAFPRDSKKEYGIFNRFITTYAGEGVAVAKYAFGPVCNGWWGRAPISVTRFAKGSDPYFTLPILERLREISAAP